MKNSILEKEGIFEVTDIIYEKSKEVFPYLDGVMMVFSIK